MTRFGTFFEWTYDNIHLDILYRSFTRIYPCIHIKVRIKTIKINSKSYSLSTLDGWSVSDWLKLYRAFDWSLWAGWFWESLVHLIGWKLFDVNRKQAILKMKASRPPTANQKVRNWTRQKIMFHLILLPIQKRFYIQKNSKKKLHHTRNIFNYREAAVF